MTTDPLQYMLLDEFILIHEHANRCQAEAEKLSSLVPSRRRGVGTSTVAFTAPSREEREREAGGLQECGETERERSLREFAKFVLEVLPFLYGQTDSPSGTKRPKKKLCTQAICCLLGVSRNFLYNRKSMASPENATEEELTSLIDTAGLRLRQHRRNGNRGNYPPVHSLPNYDCGCDMPCFFDVPQLSLRSEYNTFILLSQQLKPRHQ